LLRYLGDLQTFIVDTAVAQKVSFERLSSTSR